ALIATTWIAFRANDANKRPWQRQERWDTDKQTHFGDKDEDHLARRHMIPDPAVEKHRVSARRMVPLEDDAAPQAIDRGYPDGRIGDIDGNKQRDRQQEQALRGPLMGAEQVIVCDVRGDGKQGK